METFKNMLMHQLIKILLPNSLAYGNSIPFSKDDSIGEVISQLQVGDCIFTKTNHSIYHGCRRFLNMNYDHVSVVINSHEVINISPPIISKLQIGRIVQPNREPLIYRPPIDNKDTLLSILNNFLGEKYNQAAIPNILKAELKKRFLTAEFHEFSLQTIKYSRICTDAVLYSFCRSNTKMGENIDFFIKQKTNYSNIGFILPDELCNFFEENGSVIIYRGSSTKDKTLLEKGEQVSQSIKDIMNQALKMNVIFNAKNMRFMRRNKNLIPFLLQNQPQLRILIWVMLSLISLSQKYRNETDQSKLTKVLKWMIMLQGLPQSFFPKL